MLRLNSCFVAGKEELLQSLVRKALDHGSIVTQYFPKCNLMGYAASALLRTATLYTRSICWPSTTYHSRIASRLTAAVHVNIAAPDARGEIARGD